MSIDDNKELARRALEAFMSGDMSSLRDVLAPGAVLHQCGVLHPIPAGAILERQFPGIQRVRDRQTRVEHVVAEGDLVALHWWTSGHYSHPESVGGDVTPVSFPTMSFVRVDGGRIAEIWNIQDTATLHTQLSEEAPPSDMT